MKRKRPIDLAAVRTARARLDELARNYPELRGPRGEKNVEGWMKTLATIEEEPMAEPTQQVAFRLPVSLVESLDAYAKQMSKEQPGIDFTRADAVRVLLTRALDSTSPKKAKRTGR